MGIRDAKKTILDPPSSYPGIQLQLAQNKNPHLNPIRTDVDHARKRRAADASAQPRARATQKAEDRRAIGARRRVAGPQKALLAPRDGTQGMARALHWGGFIWG